jgi:hypothetical protein
MKGSLMPFAIKNPLKEESCFGRRPAPRAGPPRSRMGPPPAFGGRRPHKIPRLRPETLCIKLA